MRSNENSLSPESKTPTPPPQQFKPVSEYPVAEYQCGIRTGEHVRLRKDLVLRDHRDRPTGVVHRAGEIWTVLSGAAEPPVDVWLLQPDGEGQTWSDDDDFWIWFERVADDNAI